MKSNERLEEPKIVTFHGPEICVDSSGLRVGSDGWGNTLHLYSENDQSPISENRQK